MSLKRVESSLEEIQRDLEPVLLRSIQRCEERKLWPILNYCIESKAAFDRALLVRAGCEALGSDWRVILPAMAAVELMDFSVIAIDDILDEAPRRMERATLHTKWDTKIAIVAAAILKSIAANSLVEAAEKSKLSNLRTRRLLTLLENTHRQIYVGQYLDIAYQNIDISKITEEMYLRMIRLTTGIQISACIRIGALLAGGNKRQLSLLGEYGSYTGMIFQIRDDLIDYMEEENLTHKTPFLDLCQRKRRLPLILAYHKSPEIVARILRKRSMGKKDRDIVLGLIISSAVIDPIKQLVNELRSKAIQCLEDVAYPGAKGLLKEIIALGSDL
jgi:geranylgeranyl pyrophosphate synthase